MSKDTKVVALTPWDYRIETLVEALIETVYAQGEGLHVATVIGALDLAKIEIARQQEAE